MSSTLIDVNSVVSCAARIKRIKNSVSGIQSSFRATKNRIDNSIIDQELMVTISQINTRFNTLNSQLSKLSQTIERGANAYSAADNTIRGWSGEIIRENMYPERKSE